MKNEMVRKFISACRHDEPMLWDEEIALLPRVYFGYHKQIRCDHSLVFDIVERDQAKIAGEIALRIGDSPEQFYLGHIGYHIDPPYRGHAYAAKACRLCAPVLGYFAMRHVVITTDPDNAASIRTCVRLGCELESTVQVPRAVHEKLDISHVKCRFIWTLPANAEQQAEEILHRLK